MAIIKDYIHVRVRLRLATKEDLAHNKKPKLGTVYYVLQKDGNVTGSFVITKDTDLKQLNFQFEMNWLYVEETPENKINQVELYKD